MIQLNLNEFVRPKTKFYSDTQEIVRVLNTVKKWDYVPTPLAIKETFNLSHGTSVKIFETLINVECKKTYWKDNPKVRDYILNRINYSRSAFRRFLEHKQLENLLIELKNWFPQIKRRPF